MTKDEYRTRIGRLCGAFKNHEYSDEQMDLLWSKMQYKSPIDFNQAIDNLIMTERYAPMPNKIMQEIYSLDRKNISVLDKKSYPCKICDGCGHLSRTALIDGHEYSCGFLCHCKNALQWSNKIPICPDELINKSHG